MAACAQIGAQRQLTPSSAQELLERFKEAQAREEEELGERVTEAYFLELLLARYEKGRRINIVPFGLSEAPLPAENLRRDRAGYERCRRNRDRQGLP